MSAEERLKVRKKTQSVAEASGMEDQGGNIGTIDDKPRSIASASTGTVLSAPAANDNAESSSQSPHDVKKQRHISSQTITPHTSKDTTDGDAPDAERDSDPEEEKDDDSTSKRRDPDQPVDDEDPTSDHTPLEVPRTQAIEA
jgi:hypothetical protein